MALWTKLFLEFFFPSSFGRWMAKRDSHKDTQRSDFGHGGCFSFVFFLTIMGRGPDFDDVATQPASERLRRVCFYAFKSQPA
jgi:hypothetical protein